MAKAKDIVVSSPFVVRGIDRVLTVQRPVVLAHIRRIRRSRPHDSPGAIIRILERRYLSAVTAGGAAVGASAAIPAVGTGASLALSSVETAGFLEASALFAQSVTEVHGIVVDDPDRARALVMTMVLGSAGTDLVTQLAGQATGAGAGRNMFWGELVTKNMPKAAMGPIADRLKGMFIKRFAVAQGTNVVGRLMPFGIGAVIGGSGNHILGRQIIRTARAGFGPAPVVFPEWLEPVLKLPREPKQPKPAKAPKKARKSRAPKGAVPSDSDGRGIAGRRSLTISIPAIRIPLPQARPSRRRELPQSVVQPHGEAGEVGHAPLKSEPPPTDD